MLIRCDGSRYQEHKTKSVNSKLQKLQGEFELLKAESAEKLGAMQDHLQSMSHYNDTGVMLT